MYPFVRMSYHVWKARKAPKLDLFDTHVSQHICMPWDIDIWLELNNGRTLTLFDLGRLPASIRTGVADAVKDGGYGMAVAGVSVRYRRRVTAFQKLEMWTRFVGFDGKFFYIEQSMWDRKGECCNHILVRGALLKNRRMVPPHEFMSQLSPDIEPPALPDWVRAWCEAEQMRPWPPTQDAGA
ncbi:acyl-CoA thioesterase [Celeribacter indicus]|uniref:Thioeseterase n=1 Tax=Celeribacter indicus TaxID=1208324 RepID=A0A0B5DNJ0_9RHOB|nr:acyl-CoA thioesterase [Celeribacter indicus]AJE44744.1 hypothetical protein P73_0029 [Celeribacter indicus]SDX50073.1 Thioesterase-like superfamily protein [Celeribacter indicus]